MYQKIKLKNGLVLLSSLMKESKAVTVLIDVKAGSRFENEKENGIAHFLEHMLFKGSKSHPTPFEIKKEIDGIGGILNGFTGEEETGFWAKVPSGKEEKALKLLLDMVFNPLLREKDIQVEKGVVIEEINMEEDHPTEKVIDLFKSLIFKNTSLGRKILGTKECVLSFKRKDLLSYLKRFYVPNNMVIGIAGNFDQEKIINLVKKLVEKKKRGKLPPFSKVKIYQKKPQCLLEFKETDQTHLILGVRTFKRDHFWRYPLNLLSVILGGNMSSRLFVKLRDELGLAYYIKSETEGFLDTGVFSISAGVDNKRAELAISTILKELKEIKRTIKKEELKRAKEYLIGRLKLFLENTSSVASFLAEQELLEKRIKTFQEIVDQIKKVQIKDLLKVANKIFSLKNLNLAIIGPFKEKEKFEKLLKI